MCFVEKFDLSVVQSAGLPKYLICEGQGWCYLMRPCQRCVKYSEGDGNDNLWPGTWHQPLDWTVPSLGRGLTDLSPILKYINYQS